MMPQKTSRLLRYARKIAREAKEASSEIANVSSKLKNKILREVARKLRSERKFLIKENAKDLDFAKKEGISSAIMDRILLDGSRINAMSDSVDSVARLHDPVG